jgi:hypothetical protein
VQLREIRAYLSAMNGSRVDFLAKHATDPRVVAAVRLPAVKAALLG